MCSLPLAGASRPRCLSGCRGESGQLGSAGLKVPGAPFLCLPTPGLGVAPKASGGGEDRPQEAASPSSARLGKVEAGRPREVCAAPPKQEAEL